jgi:peptidoglycan/LPS O-acetylase OafA/YrhL
LNKAARNYALDWLRVGGTIAVLLFHSARFFDNGDWHVKNPLPDYGLDLFATILIQWLMPLFFILSGAGAWLALERQSAGKFAAGKVPRLLIPLLFGILVLSPPQVYLERLTHHQFAGSLFAWLPHYFDGFYAFGGNFAWMGLHLWYLLVLLTWSLVTLPLCLWLRKGAARSLAAFLARPGMIFLLVVPLVLVESLLNPNALLATQQMGGWSPLMYVLFYLYGFVLLADDRLPQAVARLWPVAALLAVLIPAFVVVSGLDTSSPYPSLRFVLMTGLRNLNAMSWLLALMGVGLRFLNFRNRFLDVAGEAVLPFYMLHQPVLLIIGYFVVQWSWPAGAKFGFIALTALVVILTIYAGLIRPFRISRFLFGMKAQPADGARRAAA